MKNLRALFLLFGANLVSGFAQGITMLSIPWYLVNQMGSEDGKLLNAAMVAVVTLGSLFWGIYAGTLIDRFNRKRIFQIFNGIDCVILLLAGSWSMYLGETPFYLMAIVFATTIFTYNVHYPNLYAFIQQLFEPKYYAKINSAIELQGQLTSALGMFIGGMLIAGPENMPAWWPEMLTSRAWDLSEIFLLDGSTYFLSFILISLIRYESVRERKVDMGSVYNRIKQGFTYLWERKHFLLLGISSHLVFFATLVTIQIVLAIYISDYLQESAYSMASFKGTYAIGAVTAGLMGLTFIVKKGHPIPKIMILMLGAGIAFGSFSLTRSLTVFLIGAYFIGICNAGVRILRITYIISVIPPRVVGRVNSFFSVINVVERFLFSLLMTITFFSAPENGENVIYAFAMLSLVIFIGIIIQAMVYKSMKHMEKEESLQHASK
jgi:MFS family permease